MRATWAAFWRDLVNAGLSVESTDPALLERVRTSNVALLLTMGLAIPFAFQYAALGIPHMTAAMLVTTAVALLTMAYLRRRQEPLRAGFFVGMTIFSLLVISNVTSGGFYDPNFGWLYTVPLVGAVVANLRAALFFCGLLVVTTIVFWSLPELGISLPSQIPPSARPLQSLFNSLSATVAIGGSVAAIVIRHRRAEERIWKLANLDQLTELPNRRRLEDGLARAIAASDEERHCAVLLIDLDRFKTINDTLGHTRGDQVLREAARRLRQVLAASGAGSESGSGATVARFGGDEFVILLDRCASLDHVEALAARVVHVLRFVFQIGGYEVFPGGSVGIAIHEPGETAEELLQRADMALYEAKRLGRGRFVVSTPALVEAEQRRAWMESRLRKALERDELTLVFQPLVDAGSGSVVACEALLRWSTPEGPISPAEFVPVAEMTGDIVPIGQWVLRQACEQLAHWRRAGLPPLRMSVNVSPRQLQVEAFPEMVLRTLAEHDIPARSLELEITESALVEAEDVTKAAIEKLSAAGIAFALDDFGTGYSSLSYLRRYSIGTIKIDRSFVMAAPEQDQDAKLIAGLTSMAHELSLRVIAEGVETQAHVDLLREIGCDELQGFHFSRPVPAAAFVRLLDVKKKGNASVA